MPGRSRSFNERMDSNAHTLSYASLTTKRVTFTWSSETVLVVSAESLVQQTYDLSVLVQPESLATVEGCD